MNDFIYYVDLGGNPGIDMFCSEACLMKVWKLTAEEVGGEKVTMSEHIENNYPKDERCFSCDRLLISPATSEPMRVTTFAGSVDYGGSGDGQALETIF